MKKLLSLAPVLLLSTASVTACKKDPEPTAIQESAPPVAQSAKTVAVGKKRFVVDEAGTISVLIDAPAEKFKGDTKKLSGVFDVDPTNLKATTGEVVGDLDAFRTHTFEHEDENDTQTEHAKNWFEIGEKVEKQKRDDHRMARFTIESVDEASVPSVEQAKEEGGFRKVHLKATGSLRVHGRSSKKTVEVDVFFAGPPTAPTSIAFKTTQPLVASLSEHDVKPRDLTGKFLAGALEKVGKKIDDKAQVHVEGTARPKG